MTSPYTSLAARAFWKTAVTERAPLDPGDLYQPKFPIPPKAWIMTAGSCFAQHIGRALRGANMKIMDAEALPRFVPDEVAETYGYRQYSARYGNIYTARQLAQLLAEARGDFSPADPVWEKNGRYFDSQRPSVEPDGLESLDEVLRHRQHHLNQVATAIRRTGLFIFTFGLTEAWTHRESGTVYPTAPGTQCGTYNPDQHAFVNFGYQEIMNDFLTARRILKRSNKRMRFIITVSPVPLTATATGKHIEVANSYSKSVLRAVCGRLADDHDDIDYFPSYEIITSLNNRGIYYAANKRNVTPEGVTRAMEMFLHAHGLSQQAGHSDDEQHDPHCDDALLEAFAG